MNEIMIHLHVEKNIIYNPRNIYKLFKPISVLSNMAAIVIVETNGTLKTLKTKEVTLDTLYKKCGYRGNDDFKLRHTWQVKILDASDNISVWAKTNGKANFENKYDFPPPIDKELFFGTCAIVRTSASAADKTSSEGTGGEILDLTKEMWEKIYAELFGGFEDVGSQDEYSEDELANADPSTLTSHGYLKDDFVVSDKEEITPAPSPPPTLTMKKKSSSKKKKADSTTSSACVAGPSAAGPSADKTSSEGTAGPTKNTKKVKTIVVSDTESNSEETPSELEEDVYNYSDED